MLRVDNLSVSVDQTKVLNDVSLVVGSGEVVALMGANGSGKSTLAQTILGNPNYLVESGSGIEFDGKDLLAMSVDERSRAGLFVAWQNPPAISGVSVLSFLRVIYEASGKKIEKMVEFRDMVLALLVRVGLAEDVIKRNLNEGFSGGEKKRFELLQLMLLRPKLAILDEIDSGLDVDGLRMVSEVVAQMRSEQTSFILITHYKKLLDYVSVDRVIVLAHGRIVSSGGSEIAEEIEQNGYAKHN